MQNIDCISYPGRINHAKRTRVIPYPNFLHTFANRGHGLEVVRLLAALYTIKLPACILPCVYREFSQALKRVTNESYGFHRSDYINTDITCNYPS